MAIEQTIITWIHLLSASIWVGGSIFLGAVLAPLLKKMSLPIDERLALMIKTGRRFNKIALPSLIILIATGIYNSHLVLQSSEILFSSSYGAYLITKTKQKRHDFRRNYSYNFCNHIIFCSVA